jgi:predicted DNA-binding transcriptional regulator AlpA
MTSIEQRKQLSDIDGCYYSAKELSEFLGVSVRTLSNYRAKGWGPKYFKFGHRTCRYAMKDILQYIQDNKSNSNTGASHDN